MSDDAIDPRLALADTRMAGWNPAVPSSSSAPA